MIKTSLEYFLDHIKVVDSGCWEWTGALDKDGYGTFGVKGKSVRPHRFAYEQFNNVVLPDSLYIDHICRNHSCVNYEHLQVVTPKQNVNLGIQPLIAGIYHTSKTHCPYGHPYNETNTIILRNGGRACRTCKNKRNKEYRLTMKLPIDKRSNICYDNHMDSKEIKELRHKLGMSQERFAAKIGVSTMTIRRWESNKFTPNQLAQKRLNQIKSQHKNTIEPLSLDKDKLNEIRDLIPRNEL